MTDSSETAHWLYYALKDMPRELTGFIDAGQAGPNGITNSAVRLVQR
jgi:hypothetical protein